MALATFTTSKTQLTNVLKQFIKVVGKYRKGETTVEITIIDEQIKLVIPGVNLNITAITSGSAKFTVGLLYLYEVLKSHPEDIIQFTIKEGLVKCNQVSFPAPTTFFKTDDILRSIDLPINFVNMHLAKLATSGKYTAGEIAFNNLTHQKEEALLMLHQDIDKITYLTQPYGVIRKDIEDLLIYKIKENY